ncbi:MAG: 2-phospho-L-lactate transferase [Thermoleophilia bacterium]|nr:2-phospho-L-lactate transferase [Thermoleophilia bacterium]
MKTILLAGGTGGAKLAAGMQAVIGSDLTVIANTGDDIEILGAHVSPDPDLVTYWLADQVDQVRGWGIKDDSFRVFERMSRLGAPNWFSLSDLDLAACLYRRNFIDEGGRQTDAQLQIGRGMGVAANVLPMSDDPVRTRILSSGEWRGLQEYLILEGGQTEVEGVELTGIAEAAPTPEVASAIADAELIVLGPSNPVISIGPILAVPGMKDLITGADAPVIAVSPYVAGKVVKGPTDHFMRAISRPTTAAGVASLYEGLIDAMICDAADPDPAPDSVRSFSTDTLMHSTESRATVARAVLKVGAQLVGE